MPKSKSLSSIPTNFQDPTTRNDRKLLIIDFVEKHAGCSISDIVKSPEREKIGAKHTIETLIEELKEEDVIIKDKVHKHSRNWKLYIKNNNPMIVIPNLLIELEIFFKDFTNGIIRTYSRPHNEWPNQEHSHKYDPINPYAMEYSSSFNSPVPKPIPASKTHPLMFERLTLYNIIQIPFVIIDIVNAPLNYYQRTSWVNYNEKLSTLLHNMIFLKLNCLHKIAFDVIRRIVRNPYSYADSGDDSFDHLYTTMVVENRYESYSIFEKICLVRHVCNSMGLQEEIDRLLNYWIDNNDDYFSRIVTHIISTEQIPDFDWPDNNGWPDFESISKSKLEVIHDLCCPGVKSKIAGICNKLDKDPTTLLTI